MKKKTKKTLKNFGIVFSIILVLSLLIYFGFIQQTFLPINDATTYSTISYDKDTITYSILDRQGELNGFTSTHRNSEYLGQNFEYGADNKNLFAPYLEYNGINSDNFILGGYKPLVCVFTPNEIKAVPDYKSELESLGFTYMYEVQSHQISTCGSDCPTCGDCASCLTGLGCSGDKNRCCANNGFYSSVIDGESACWTGNYQTSKLNEIASKMDCFVEGTVTSLCSGSPVGASDRCISFNQAYSIRGIVSYSNGFICEVDESILKAQLPTTMIQPSDGLNKTVEKIGIDGTVTFKLKELNPIEYPVNYYELLDNICTEISILPSLSTSNDYLTQQECEQHIIITPKPPIGLIAAIMISIIVITLSILILLKRRKGGRR